MAAQLVASLTSLPPGGGAPGRAFRFGDIPHHVILFTLLPMLNFNQVNRRSNSKLDNTSDIDDLANTSRFWKQLLTAPTLENVFKRWKESSKTLTSEDVVFYSSFLGNNFTSEKITRVICHLLDVGAIKEYPGLSKVRTFIVEDIPDGAMRIEWGQVLAKAFPELRVLQFDKKKVLNGWRDPNCLEVVLAHPQLESLDQTSHLSIKELGQILNKCTKLKNLSIQLNAREDFDSQLFSVHKNITHLKMNWKHTLENLAEFIEHFPNLKSLEIVHEDPERLGLDNPSHLTESEEEIIKRLRSIRPSLVITFSEVEPLQVEDDDEIDFGDLDDEVQPTAARRCSCLTTAIGVVGLAAIAYVSPWAGLAGVCTYGAYRIRKLF